MIRKAGIAILLALMIFLLININLVIYGIGQGVGQLKILWNAEPLEKVLADPGTDQQIREQLILVQDIKKFCRDELGMSDNGNYSKFYDHGSQPILWIVRACQPFAFESKEWSFPIVGSVSYKGFFDLSKAKSLRDELNAEGWDTYVRDVTAWSTLGWFKDPILSGMLSRSEGELANTIIHELTHTNIFIEDELDFNENLASFIGDKGAEAYLKDKYGDSSKLVQEYISLREDRKLLYDHFLRGTNFLDSVYQSMDGQKDRKEKYAIKESTIDLVVSSIDTLATPRSAEYMERYQSFDINNAYLMSYKVYRGKQQKLDSLFDLRYNQDIRLMFRGLLDYDQSQLVSLIE